VIILHTNHTHTQIRPCISILPRFLAIPLTFLLNRSLSLQSDSLIPPSGPVHCPEWRSIITECHDQKIATGSAKRSQISVSCQSRRYTLLYFLCFRTSYFTLHQTRPMSLFIHSSTARSLSSRFSAHTSLPYPSPSSPRPLSWPMDFHSLSLTSPATSRPLSRPYCRNHSPQNTDASTFLPQTAAVARPATTSLGVSTRWTFWASLVSYTRSTSPIIPSNIHSTRSLVGTLPLRWPYSSQWRTPSPIAVMRSTATPPCLTSFTPGAFLARCRQQPLPSQCPHHPSIDHGLTPPIVIGSTAPPIHLRSVPQTGV
jgi:hypothetical protein